MVMIFCNEQVTLSTSSRAVLVNLPATATTSQYVTFTPHHLEQDPNSLDTIIEQALQIPGFRETYISVMKELAPLVRTADGKPTLTSLRMELGIPREEMAQALGISDRTMCEFENGNSEKMTRQQMLKLTQLLKCNMDALNNWLGN
jgi:DNA-binding XRE family transcriptional regulator